MWTVVLRLGWVLWAIGLNSSVWAQAAPSTPYQFSPVNQYGITLTASYWNPILSYVSARSGVPLQLKIGRTSADTTAFVLAKEVDFVFSNHLFNPEREKLGWRVLARRDSAAVRGQIIVPAESEITEMTQLEGHPVVFPGPEATVAYKFTYGQLLSRKIAVQVVFAGNMDAAFAQLVAGKAKAMGANSQLVENYAQREGRKFRVLWASEPLADLALMASSRISERDRRAVAEAFVGMAKDPQGREVLAAASAAVGQSKVLGFVSSDGSEYEPYRQFFRTAPTQVH